MNMIRATSQMTLKDFFVAPLRVLHPKPNPDPEIPTLENAQAPGPASADVTAQGSQRFTLPASIPQTKPYEHLLTTREKYNKTDSQGRLRDVRQCERVLLSLNRPLAIKRLSEGSSNWRNIAVFHTHDGPPCSRRPKVNFDDSDDEESSESEDDEGSESEGDESDAESDYEPAKEEQQEEESPHRSWVMAGNPWASILRTVI